MAHGVSTRSFRRRSGFRLRIRGLPLAGAPRKEPFHFRQHGNREARKVTGHRPRVVSGDGARPGPSLTRLSNGGAGRSLRRLRRSLWRQSASRVHGARLTDHAPARGCGRRDVTMSASLVRATVRAVSKRKLQPTRAALTLVSRGGPGRRAGLARR
ncbi:Iron-sulfur cluster assembly 1 homolog, mitochondrial [Lemmus lemmus]